MLTLCVPRDSVARAVGADKVADALAFIGWNRW
jgi:formate dehydrogenase iron-sulfur subunit